MRFAESSDKDILLKTPMNAFLYYSVRKLLKVLPMSTYVYLKEVFFKEYY